MRSRNFQISEVMTDDFEDIILLARGTSLSFYSSFNKSFFLLHRYRLENDCQLCVSFSRSFHKFAALNL